MSSIHPVKVSTKVRRYRNFLFGHMSEVNLPIFTGLAATELVEGLAEMESALRFAWEQTEQMGFCKLLLPGLGTPNLNPLILASQVARIRDVSHWHQFLEVDLGSFFLR
jgi:hypothetical protein